MLYVEQTIAAMMQPVKRSLLEAAQKFRYYGRRSYDVRLLLRKSDVKPLARRALESAWPWPTLVPQGTRRQFVPKQRPEYTFTS